MIDTPIGELMLIQSDKGLKQIIFEKKIPAFKSQIELNKNRLSFVKDEVSLNKTIQQINEYFLRKRREFQIKIDISMPPFYQQALSVVMKIPYGEVRSYKEIAQFTQNPSAYRAVGTANAKNPLPIIIPCHRIVSSNGNLGGYSGGLDKKSFLLDHESNLLHE